jgi:hypothetical protein
MLDDQGGGGPAKRMREGLRRYWPASPMGNDGSVLGDLCGSALVAGRSSEQGSIPTARETAGKYSRPSCGKTRIGSNGAVAGSPAAYRRWDLEHEPSARHYRDDRVR